MSLFENSVSITPYCVQWLPHIQAEDGKKVI